MIKIVLDSKLALTGDIPKDVESEIKRRLTMENPEWVENNKMGYWNGNTPWELTFYEETESGLLVPRGYMRKAVGYLRKEGVSFEIDDQTRALPEIDFSFHGQLKDFQQGAAGKILARRFGVAQMPTGSGKTIVALYCIAQRKQPALVIVHTKDLLYQWKQAALQFLSLADSQVGLLGDGHHDLGKPLTVAIVRSLCKRAEQYRDQTGFLIVDECHRVPSRTFSEAVGAFDSRYMLGLSATPDRRDGLARQIYLYLGDRVSNASQKKLQELGHIMGADLVVRETGFDYPYADDYQAMIKALTLDADRNHLIADDVSDFAKHSNGPALVVSDRKDHCKVLSELVRKRGVDAVTLTGDIKQKERNRIIADLNAGKIDVLIATTQLLGEGFDCKSLSALFLATPVKYKGKLQQVIGRILRSESGKARPVVYDYVDMNGVLRASFGSRMETYQKLGISISN